VTKQEYFNLLEKTSLEGRFPSLYKDFDGSNGDRCMYLSEEGNKCAFGLLIPDELYDPSFEGETVEKLIPNHLPASLIPEGMNLDQVYDIQNIHDTLALRNKSWNHDKFMSRITEVFYR